MYIKHKRVRHDHYRMGTLPFGPNRRVHVRVGVRRARQEHSLGRHGVPQVERSPMGTGGSQGRFTHGEHGAVVGMKSQAVGRMQEPPLAAQSGEPGCSESPYNSTARQHGGSEHTGAPHTRRRIGRHGSCDEARRAQGEPGGPSARWGWPQAGPAQKGVAALWGWEGRVRRPAPAPHAAQASRGVLGVLCSQGVWAGGGEVALSGQGRASWRPSLLLFSPFFKGFVRVKAFFRELGYCNHIRRSHRKSEPLTP